MFAGELGRGCVWGPIVGAWRGRGQSALELESALRRLGEINDLRGKAHTVMGVLLDGDFKMFDDEYAMFLVCLADDRRGPSDHLLRWAAHMDRAYFE